MLKKCGHLTNSRSTSKSRAMFKYTFLPSSQINSAPWIFKSEVELDMSIEDFWITLIDDRSWKHWHPEVTNIQNTKVGFGNSRTVVFRHWFFMALLAGPVRIHEDFDVWEADDDQMKRFQFWLSGASRPSFLTYQGGREEFKVEAISAKRCKFTRTVALIPSFLSRYALGFAIYPMLRSIFTVQCPRRLLASIEKKVLPLKQDDQWVFLVQVFRSRMPVSLETHCVK